MKPIVPMLGKIRNATSRKAERVLQWTARSRGRCSRGDGGKPGVVRDRDRCLTVGRRCGRRPLRNAGAAAGSPSRATRIASREDELAESRKGAKEWVCGTPPAV